MKIAIIMLLTSANYALSSCTPSNAVPLEKPNLDEPFKVFILRPPVSVDSAFEKNNITITNYNIFDSSNTTKQSFRYVLPDFSASGFLEINPKLGGSSYRPLSLQQTNLTFSPLQNSDELKQSIDFETIDISGKLIGDVVKKIESEKQKNYSGKYFDGGAKCYKMINIHNYQDFIQYDTKNQINFKVNENGDSKDYHKVEFGSYAYYINKGSSIQIAVPTDVIVSVPPRFFKGTFHPKQTYAINTLAKNIGFIKVLSAAENTQNQCHAFNAIAAENINN